MTDSKREWRGFFYSYGCSIADSYELFRSHWRPHLQRSKAFQRFCLRHSTGGSAAVFGAGRMFDLNLRALAERFDSIEFADADESSVPHWMRFQSSLKTGKMTWRVGDLTNSLEIWSDKLREFTKAQPEIEAMNQFLRGLRTEEKPKFEADTVISLNLLGQISSIWAGHFLRTINGSWQKRPQCVDFKLQPLSLEDALDASELALETQHLELLAQSARKEVILIADVVNNYWKGEQPVRVLPAISVDPDKLALSGFKKARYSSWTWDRFPIGAYQRDYAVRATVGGWHFVRDA